MPLDILDQLSGLGAKNWKLKGIDPQFTTEFEGQSVAQGMEESIGSALGESSSVNKPKPNFQWLRGEAETFSFSTRLFSSNSFKNIRQQVNLLKSFTRRNVDLKRAPRFLFSAGTEIAFTCFVRSVRFRYDELRSDGSLRGAVIDLGLQIIDDSEPESAIGDLTSLVKFASGVVSAGAEILSSLGRLINIPGASLHTVGRTVVAKEGQTFEAIAKAEYGNPLVGDILRRIQPDKADLKPGDTVVLVDRSEITQIRVTPQSVPLKNTQTNLNLRDEKLLARNRPTTIFV